MTTAEELLCSRRWRMARSLWMLFGWFPFAFAAWIGYLIIGVKSRNGKWIALSIAFFVFGVTAFSLMVWVGNSADVDKGESFPEPFGTISSVVLWSTLLVWIGNAAVLQWFINRRWLVWRAQNDRKVTTPWYATATATATGAAAPHPDQHRVASVFDATLANGSATTASDATRAAPSVYPAPPAYPAPSVYPAPPAPAVYPANAAPPTPPPAASAPPVAMPTADASQVALDINSATQAELTTLPGFDAATAAQVISARQQGGAFRHVSDLVARAGVKPHVVAGLSGRVAMVAESPRAPGAPNGRRLEF